MELDAGARAPVSILQSIALGFITALASGILGAFLFIAGLVVADPTELTDTSLGQGLAELLFMFVFVALFGALYALIFSWFPIAIVGLAMQRAACRWPFLWSRPAHSFVGAICGIALSLLGVRDGRFETFDLLLLLYGALCGIFAALFFRYLTNKLPSA